MQTSKQKASVCRMVHVYHREHGGPMAGVVVSAPMFEPLLSETGQAELDRQYVNLSVFPDPSDERQEELRHRFRSQPEGNALFSVPLYDALSAEDRETVRKSADLYWAEWPPREQPPARTQPDGAPAE